MEEFEPKRKVKIVTKEFLAKNAYIFVLAIVMIFGVAYGYTFFVQNKKIASGSITTAALTINFTDRSISASNLSVPTTDGEGLLEFSKSVTITNQTTVDGRVKLTLTKTSGLDLTDLRYALIVNGAIQTIGDVPTTGQLLESAIMGNETVNVEVRLWPKTTYTGSVTTFVGELTPEIRYLGKTITGYDNLTGKYVNFNCNNNTCEKWQIVKVEDDRLVLTKQSDYINATSRTNSNKYDSTLGLHDDGNLITSTSTDGKNVYLAKTVKLSGGDGTIDNPYILVNNIFREPDKKAIAQITYKDNNNTTLGTQNIYYNEINYISRTMNDPSFQYWTDGTNNYNLGDIISISTDTNLNAYKVVNAVNLSFDNTITGFSCTDAQCALEALDGLLN